MIGHSRGPALDGGTSWRRYAWPAPHVLAPPRRQVAVLRRAMGAHAAGQTLLIGAYEAEREWCAMARLAGYLPAGQFFSQG
ncbi:MAG: hypothetical protein ACK5M4_10000 [Pseudorhodobacter sp.]